MKNLPPFLVQHQPAHPLPQIKRIWGNSSFEQQVSVRVIFQTKDLLGPLTLPEAQLEAIIKHMIDRIAPNLNHVNAEVARLIKEADDEITSLRIAEAATLAPYMMNLDQIAANVLYNFKQLITEVRNLLPLLISDAPRFSEGNDIADAKGAGGGMVAEWLDQRFGLATQPGRILRAYQDAFVREMVRKRNAYEHPGSRSGTLQISNLEVTPEGVAGPIWAREGQPTLLLQDVFDASQGALMFVEDFVARIVEALAGDEFPLRIRELPVELRDNDVPKRLVWLVPDQS